MSYFKIRMGTDFEFFAKSKNGVVPGEKVITENKSGIVIDGLAVEVQPDASDCRDSIKTSIRNKMKELKESKIFIHESYSADFKKDWDNIQDENKILGCDPDYDAYSGKMNVLKIKDNETKRYAGGHIHLGGNQTRYGSSAVRAINDHKNLIPLLDLVVGIPSVLMDRQDNKSRRLQYGKAGSFRKKPYGVEYRVLSNFWVSDIRLFYLFFGLARTAVNILYNHYTNTGTHLDILGELWKNINKNDVIEAINENDFNLAKKIFDEIAPILNCWSSIIGGIHTFPLADHGLAGFKYVCMNPIDTSNIIENWINPKQNHGWSLHLNGLSLDEDKIEKDWKNLKVGKNIISNSHVKNMYKPSGTYYSVLNKKPETPLINGKSVYGNIKTRRVVVDGKKALAPVTFFDGQNAIEGCFAFCHDIKKEKSNKNNHVFIVE